jgi:molybdenum cofactor guanylyltransferase
MMTYDRIDAISRYISCAILAGGRSRRFGRDKATATFGDRTLIEHVYSVAKTVFRHIVIVSSRHQVFAGVDADVIADLFPVPGSLSGIVSALVRAETKYVFVLGCDMPFVTPASISCVVEAAVRDHDVMIPGTAVGLEPLHALYARSCISPMLTAVERGNMRIARVFPLLSVHIVETNAAFFSRGVSVFTNVNTDKDLEEAKRLLSKQIRRGDANADICSPFTSPSGMIA